MSKFIDTDKLIAEIERRKYEWQAILDKNNDANSEVIKNIIYEDENILNVITSLQQEQPKFKVGDTIHKIGENTVFPMTIERIYDRDYVCVTEHQQSFINIESQDNYELVEQEQPEIKSYIEELLKECAGKNGEYYRSRRETLAHLFAYLGGNPLEYILQPVKQPEVGLFECPETPIKDAVEVTSRMEYIDENLKPIAEFIMDYASWNLHKNEWNQPTIEVPLFRVLDALAQRGKPYCCSC